MAKRFEQLYKLSNNLYFSGSPVIVSAGALLKDKQTDSVIVQLKFQSVSSTPIKALKVGIAAYDIAGKKVDGVEEYQYLDLSISNGQTFGSNKAIVMPNIITRSFAINSISVVMADGIAKDVSKPIMPLPEKVSLLSVLKDSELVKQYKLAINEDATYIPQQANDLWMCSCGEWNNGDCCTKCRAKKTEVFYAYDTSALTEKMTSRLATEETLRKEQERLIESKKQEEAKQLAMEEKRRSVIAKKSKIVLTIICPVAVLALFFTFWLYPDVIKPSIVYNNAQEMLVEENYIEALNIFSRLGSYKNSAYYVNQCRKKIGEIDQNSVLSLFKMIDYGIPIKSVCSIMKNTEYTIGRESYLREMDIMHKRYQFNTNYTLNGILSEIDFVFEWDDIPAWTDEDIDENAGTLISMTWECPEEIANYQMYLELKEYISCILGAPTEEGTSANNDGEIYRHYSYWNDMQLSFSTIFGEDVYFTRSKVWK